MTAEVQTSAHGQNVVSDGAFLTEDDRLFHAHRVRWMVA